MLLNQLNLGDDYDSDSNNILEELIKPSLRASNLYFRSVGFLDSKLIGLLADEYQLFAQSGGKARLLLGATVSFDDYQAIRDGVVQADTFIKFPDIYSLWLSQDVTQKRKKGLLALSWLIANKIIEVKFSIRPKGIHHPKFAYFKDEGGSEVVVHGSNNETEAANSPEFNYEELSVYKSWDGDGFEKHGLPKLKRFLNQWEGVSKRSIIVPAPNEILEKAAELYKDNKDNKALSFIYEELKEAFKYELNLPNIPEYIGDTKYKLYPHQEKARKQYFDNDYRGVFALATGSGKTITALDCATRLARALHKENDINVLVVVSVPYTVLAEQWIEVMNLFGYDPIPCFDKQEAWRSKLEFVANINVFGTEKPSIYSAVAVNKTLGSEEFQRLVKNFTPDQIIFIGDECHRLGGLIQQNKMPNADYRIGLSATPWAPSEESLKNNLISYFGKVVAHYGMQEAFDDEVLVPYSYHLKVVSLSYDEGSRYLRFTRDFKKLIAQKQAGAKVDEKKLSTLYNLKMAVLGSAQEKFELLPEVFLKLKDGPGLDHVIVYCGSGTTEINRDDDTDHEAIRDIERAQFESKNSVNLNSSRVTAKENSAKRKYILNAFQSGALPAVFAIKVLDEGFDMPGIKSAVLLASSRNERQFIQRRGRVLRKSNGKSKAEIYDFIVVDNSRSISDDDGWKEDYAYEMVRDEIMRAIEFARFSENVIENEKLLKALSAEYGMDFDQLRDSVESPRYEV